MRNLTANKLSKGDVTIREQNCNCNRSQPRNRARNRAKIGKGRISKPILATLTLFYMVDRWNEWYNALIFIHDNSIIPLQVVLRSIVMESNISSNTSSAQAAVRNFDMGIKMGAVMLTSLPIMCVFPFLQKHFAKGVMVGAIKA